MERRSIGSLHVSVIGVGTNTFGNAFGGRMTQADVQAVAYAALDHGINFFDTADSYGASEERLGEALGPRREEAVIATKFGRERPDAPGSGDGRPRTVRAAVEASLRRLKTDYIDLYQLHRPDERTPITETIGALDELVTAGLVREIGCSNFDGEQIRRAHQAGDTRAQFVCVQNQFNVLHRDDEADALPVCRELGLAYLPYSPLSNGVLAGKYRRDAPEPQGTRRELWGELGRSLVQLDDETYTRVETLASWAADHAHSVLELALAWLAAQKPIASVIAGATSPEQVRANAAAGSWRLTADQVAEVRQLAD